MPVEVREGKNNITLIVSHQTTSTRSTWIALTRAIRIELELPRPADLNRSTSRA